MLKTLRALLALLLLAAPALTQQRGHILQPAGKGHIQGRVVDAQTKQPLAGAIVAVLGGAYGAAAGDAGLFRVDRLGEAVYALKISHIGYVDYVETDVRVVRGKTTDIGEVQLTPSPLLLDTGVTARPEITAAPVAVQSLQREEIRRNPGTAGDVLRAIGSLPGVSSSEGEFSAMSVRGGGAHDNLILIDNIPFEKINHFEGGSAEQETQGGRFSVFTAGLIEQATFYGGGFGAEYGGKNASVLDLRVKEGNAESATVNGSYDLLGLELNYDGPTHLLGNTSLVLNYRDFDMTYGLELMDLEDFGDPTLSDLIAKTTTYINPANQLSLLGIYSTDRLLRAPRNLMAGDDLVENDLWDIDESRLLLGANWRLLTGAKSVLHNTLYYRGNDRFRSIGYAWADAHGGQLPPTVAGLGYRQGIGVQNQRESEIGWKADFDYAASERAAFNAGVELHRIDLDYDHTQNGLDTLYQFTRLDPLPDPQQKYLVVRPEDADYRFGDAAVHLATYANYDHTVGRLTLTPGLRHSYNGFSARHALAPRLQARYQLTPRTTLNFATGIYYQKPLNRHVVGPAGRALRDERAAHAILGLNRRLRDDLRFTLEGYYKRLDDLITPATLARAQTNDGDGWASGFDAILLKRFTRRYYGQVSYSFAVSKRDDRDGFGEYDSPYNQPHNFAVILGRQINSAWFVSGRWKYAVGRPKDRFVVHRNVFGDAVRYAKEITARNADRVDDFHVLSVRVDYRRQLGRFALVTFFDLDNLYNHYNAYEDRFSELTGEEKGLGFGFLGNAGFKLEF